MKKIAQTTAVLLLFGFILYSCIQLGNAIVKAEHERRERRELESNLTDLYNSRVQRQRVANHYRMGFRAGLYSAQNVHLSYMVDEMAEGRIPNHLRRDEWRIRSIHFWIGLEPAGEDYYNLLSATNDNW